MLKSSGHVAKNCPSPRYICARSCTRFWKASWRVACLAIEQSLLNIDYLHGLNLQINDYIFSIDGFRGRRCPSSCTTAAQLCRQESGLPQNCSNSSFQISWTSGLLDCGTLEVAASAGTRTGVSLPSRTLIAYRPRRCGTSDPR